MCTWWRRSNVRTCPRPNLAQPCSPQPLQASSPGEYYFLRLVFKFHSIPSKAEIYLLLAARLRLSWPRLPKLLQRRALLAADRIADKSEVDGELAWLVGHHGRQFFLNESWSLAAEADADCWGLTSPPPALQPVAQIVRAFRNSRLQTALHTINCPTAGSQLTEVLPTLAAVSRSNQLLGSLTGDRHDPVADWWTSLLSCSAHWSLDNVTNAELTFSDIDQLPALYQVRAPCCNLLFSDRCLARVCRTGASQPFVTSTLVCLDSQPASALYFVPRKKGKNGLKRRRAKQGGTFLA